MTSFKDFLCEQLKDDKRLEKDFYKGLEKARISVETAAFRENARLAQTELAKRAGISQSALCAVDRGAPPE